MKNNIQAVVFDCDGVMFDTTKANKAYYNHILAKFGQAAMTEEQFAFTHMHTVDMAMDHLFPDEKLYAKAQAYRRTMTYAPFFKYMEMEPALKGLLKALRPRFKTAVASNRSDTMASVLSIHGLEDDFDMMVCSLDVTKPKPDPEMLLKVADHFGIRPDQALYVGDSILDQQAADAAGMPLVAYRNRELSSARNHIESLEELTGILL